jgi:hypothetical protein
MQLDREHLMKLVNIEPRRSMATKWVWSVGLFFGGALVGAGVALLVAPKSGSELRKDLADHGIDPILQRLDTMTNSASHSENTPRA